MPKPTLCIRGRDGHQSSCDGPVEGLVRLHFASAVIILDQHGSMGYRASEYGGK
jgi:hypothetical protein